MSGKLDRVLLGYDELADPRLLEVDRSTRLLHVEALAWCANYRTDGWLTRAALRRLTDAQDPDAAAATLVAAGLWAVGEGGWRLDWSKQLSRAAADGEETRNRAKWTRQKDRQRKHQDGDHSRCDKRWCPHADRKVDDSVDSMADSRASDLTEPDRPDALKESKEGRSSTAGAKGGQPLQTSCHRCGRTLEPAADVEAFPTAAGVRLRHRACVEPEAAPPIGDGTAAIICRDYNAHRDQHRKLADGWACLTCSPLLDGRGAAA